MPTAIAEIFRFRSLVGALVVRHLASRYRGSILGFLWSFLNPLFLMLVYTLVFKFYIRFEEVHNYTIFIFCGLLPWIWTQSALIEGSTAITSSGHLITKSMFPAHILPTVAVITSMIHFLLSLPLLLLFMLYFQMPFHLTLLVVPFIIVLHFALLCGASWFLSALNVQFRDVQHVIGNLLNLVFFLSPVLYPRTTVPERYRFTFDYNPIAILIETYHGLIIDGILPTLSSMVILSAWALIMLLLGGAVYQRYRENFAELL